MGVVAGVAAASYPALKSDSRNTFRPYLDPSPPSCKPRMHWRAGGEAVRPFLKIFLQIESV